MRERVLGRMIFLGHDKSILSDAIVAVEPLNYRQYSRTDDNGHKLRSRVLIAHAEGEMLASRTAQTILRDMTKKDEAKDNLSQIILGDIIDTEELHKCNELLEALRTYDTIKEAIESLPYGKSKFYELIKKYNIHTGDFRNFNDDADMAKDNIGLE